MQQKTRDSVFGAGPAEIHAAAIERTAIREVLKKANRQPSGTQWF